MFKINRLLGSLLKEIRTKQIRLNIKIQQFPKYLPY